MKKQKLYDLIYKACLEAAETLTEEELKQLSFMGQWKNGKISNSSKKWLESYWV